MRRYVQLVDKYMRDKTGPAADVIGRARELLEFRNFERLQFPRDSLWSENFPDKAVKRVFDLVADENDDSEIAGKITEIVFPDLCDPKPTKSRVSAELLYALECIYMCGDYLERAENFKDSPDRLFCETLTPIEERFGVCVTFCVWVGPDDDPPTYNDDGDDDAAKMHREETLEKYEKWYFDRKAIRKIQEQLVEYCKRPDVVALVEELLRETREEAESARVKRARSEQ